MHIAHESLITNVSTSLSEYSVEIQKQSTVIGHVLAPEFTPPCEAPKALPMLSSWP